jgi:hypothetical protein
VLSTAAGAISFSPFAIFSFSYLSCFLPRSLVSNNRADIFSFCFGFAERAICILVLLFSDCFLVSYVLRGPIVCASHRSRL